MVFDTNADQKNGSASTTQKEDTMKKGYWVVAFRSISNESAVKAYEALAVPAVQSFGGRFLTMTWTRNATTASLKVRRLKDK
jgi:Domain of unknown function (DUF1330)